MNLLSRSRSWLLLGAFASVVGLTACSGTAAEPETDNSSPDNDSDHLSAIQEDDTLSACTTGDYPPFTELDDQTDELTGIDVDMAEHLATTMGVEVEWVHTSWSDLMDDFLAECDIAVGGISMNPVRAEQVFFTAAILEDGKTPITRCENVDEFKTIDDINQPEVVSIFPEGGTNQEFAEEHFPDGELVTHDNLTIFDEVANGNADVMTTDRAEVLYIANEYDELCAANPDETFDYSVMGYMLPQGDTVFKHYVDQWLTIALNDGTYDEFAEPWVGDVDLTPDH